MDWTHPKLILFAIPAVALLLWFDAKSSHPMSPLRRRVLLVVRSLLVVLLLVALAGPAKVVVSDSQAVVFVLDHSQSLGEGGLGRVYDRARELSQKLGSGIEQGFVSAASEPRVLAAPDGSSEFDFVPRTDLLADGGQQTDLAAAVAMAQGIFPAGVARHVVVVSDGVETRGSLEDASRQAAVSGVVLHTSPVAGDLRPDVRVTALTPSQTRLNEGASLEVTATVESSLDGSGTARLFENGIEVEQRPLELSVGDQVELSFTRSPDQRNLYNYRVVVDGFEGDAIVENNEALTVVDVHGKPLVLCVEGEESESRYLRDAMAREGIRLEYRPADAVPQTLREMAGYDAIVFSDIPAHRVGERAMASIEDYVEELGGGFIMIGGMNSFGVGGYYRTPIEEVLPVRLKAPDQEEFQSSALALVLDRSGSMSGQKIEICKSAAIATSELLSRKDSIGVYAFDSNVHVVLPMTKVTSTSQIASQIATLTAGGGTNIMPGMAQARLELGKARTKIKHMIILTDGQTSGTGYEAVAAQCRAEGITISTVAIGGGSQVGLLQRIAAAGGGRSYTTMDPGAITRIFTQDTMTHTGRMIREEAFEPVAVEDHPMLGSWTDLEAPPLLGYVKTNRKATAQAPLVTDTGDPLLATWRYGLGKVTAFTSDAKSRWAALWVSGWPGFSQFWAQLLRETARVPQGRGMDLQLTSSGDRIETRVELLEDAGTFKNDAEVRTDVFFVPAHALGAGMERVASESLNQVGPGVYSGGFLPDQPGVYMVRARAGANTVSAGVVHNPSSEASTGQTNDALLKSVAEATGGGFLAAGEGGSLDLRGAAVAGYVELWPALVLAALALFLVDLAVRRWENVLGVVGSIRAVIGRLSYKS